jgi:superfamily I DNA and/or RNA helicase
MFSVYPSFSFNKIYSVAAIASICLLTTSISMSNTESSSLIQTDHGDFENSTSSTDSAVKKSRRHRSRSKKIKASPVTESNDGDNVNDEGKPVESVANTGSKKTAEQIQKKAEKRRRQKENKKLRKQEDEMASSVEKIIDKTKINSEDKNNTSNNNNNNNNNDNDDLKKSKKAEKRKRQKENKKLRLQEESKEIHESIQTTDSTELLETKSKGEYLKEKKAEKRKKQKENKMIRKEQELTEAKAEESKNDKLATEVSESPSDNINDSKKLAKAEKRKRQKENKKVKQQQDNYSEKIEEPVTEKSKHDQKSEKTVIVSNDISESKLTLNNPINLNIDLYDTLEFHCDDCPVELNSSNAAFYHVSDFGHNSMSVFYNSLSDNIKCQSCGDTNLSELHSILVHPKSINLCCSSCLNNAGYDPLIYSFSTKEDLLKYVDNMYRFFSLKCFGCESTDDLAVDEDLTCYCGKCIQKDSDLKKAKFVKKSDESFLETLFDDPHYNEFKNFINLAGQNTSNNSPISLSEEHPVKQEEASTSTTGKESKKSKKNKNKNENEKEKKSQESIEIVPSTESSNSKQKLKRKRNRNKNTDEKKGIDTGSNRTLSIQSKIVHNDSRDSLFLENLTVDELKIENKFSKLKNIVKDTIPKNIQLKFDDLQDYYHYLTYSLFLEELYSNDICSDVEFDWYDEDQCTMLGSTKTWFDMYVNDDVHHLKKQPFVRDQPIFIVRKSDIDLNWTTEPEFWVARISGNTLAKVDRRGRKVKARPNRNAVVKKSNQHSTFNLKLYSWNKNKFPINEKGNQFAFLPAGNVLGRILNSMDKIENKNFINLILGTKPVKKINFKNNLKFSGNKLNDSQMEALQSAFNNTVTILQGPPGSGKTSTIYEIILQLLENLHYYPILVVAASNLAVDNIAEKLLPKYKDIILRITSLSKEKEYSLDHPLGSICLHNKISQILPPNLQDIERRLKRNSASVSSGEFSKYLDACSRYADQFIKQANIIFATTAGIAGPYLKKKEMPVIIMDEATQSSEPSTLIPLGAKGCKKVILVGDTAQLSVFTRVKSLEMSLFQRVLENGTYPDPLMLDTQYRMHPDISEFSRKQFYDNKLKDGITAADRKKPTIKYPVFFFDHQGIGAPESKQFSVSGEEFGFSWINTKEVSYIERMVENLIVDHHVSPKSIGVMTGYAAQRDLIVKALENNKLINPYHAKTNKYIDKEDLSEKKNVTVCNVNGIIVATIDAFQGREMDFVLLSTVRSNDINSIGFMSDKRRMNVAFTRAKYSFIICGNANCLSSNYLWKSYINDLRAKNYVKNSINDY